MLVYKLINFYNDHYPLTEISVCECSESESMKIFCNSFYSVKLQFFNELYLLCQKNNVNYNPFTKAQEEFKELQQALLDNDRVEQVDALIDILVVTIGALHSAGFDAEGAWKEVMRTNFAKIDKETGKVRKREDGKVLKPLGWEPPELKQFVQKAENA